MKLYIVGKNELCGGCGWKAQYTFMLGETEEEARRKYDVNERGLCGECIAEMLIEDGYQIEKQEKSKE